MTKRPTYELNSIYLYLTQYCNLNCQHCWIDPSFTKSDGSQKSGRDIDMRYIISALEQAKKLGLKHVKLTGGEPFLREDAIDLLKWIGKNKLSSNIETNGTLIREKEARAIKAAGIRHVSVSLDGPTALLHEKMRKVPGSFERSKEGIRYLRRYCPDTQLQIIASLWRGNRSRINQMVPFAKKLGAASLKINSVGCMSARGDKMQSKGELLSVKETIQAYHSMMNYVQKSRSLRDFPVIFDIPLAFKPLEKVVSNGKCVCGIKSLLGIVGDGTVSMCGIGKTVKELNMGNIKEDKIKDIWEKNKILRQIRNDLPGKLEGICAKCIFKQSCIGKCRADAFWAKGSIFAPFTFCQEAYEEGLFPETRMI